MARRNTSKKPVMLLCHFSDGELNSLDTMQGGPSIDPLGIREYSRLAPIFDIPEVKEIFYKFVTDITPDGKLTKANQRIYDLAKKNMPNFSQTAEEKRNPFIKKFEKMGVDGDTKLAFVPENVVRFFIELNGGVPSLNPTTGLLQFGPLRFVKNIVSAPAKLVDKVIPGTKNLVNEGIRAAATVAGFMYGGPMGAGAARGVAGWATGQKPGDAAMAGIKNYGYANMANMAGNVMSNYVPGITSHISNVSSSMLPESMHLGLSNALTSPNMFLEAGKSLMGAGANTAGNTAGAVGNAAASTAENAKNAADSAGWLSPKTLGTLGVLGLGYMGSQQKYKQDQKRYQQEQEARQRNLEGMGMLHDWKPLPPKPPLRHNPRARVGSGELPFLPDEYSAAHGYAHGGSVQSYKEGAMVKGPGKGQDDLIRTHIPEGSYIIDATSTSMLGDGSSDAGAQILKHFEEKLRRSIPGHKYVEIEQRTVSASPQLPVYLSNDEYKFDPVTVSILGGGSNERGSALLKKMVKNLRKHKNSNGDRLPPKAKPPHFYMKGR